MKSTYNSPERKFMNNKYEAYKPTSDDFCPNFPNNMVEVSAFWLAPCPVDGQLFRVCVWGDDDIGMEIDVNTAEEGMKIFLSILAQDVVTIKYLKQIGMQSA